jgi:hypothetical protein
MTRLVQAALAALALAVATPTFAGDCHGDCANCPRKSASGKGDTASKDAAPCACTGGKDCKCAKGCQCDHCSHKPDEKASRAAPAPAKT